MSQRSRAAPRICGVTRVVPAGATPSYRDWATDEARSTGYNPPTIRQAGWHPQTSPPEPDLTGEDAGGEPDISSNPEEGGDDAIHE